MHATQLPAPCSSRPQLLQPHHRPLLSPGSHSLTTSSRRWTQQCQAAPVFEPQVDTQALTAQLLVLGVTAGTAAYWWLSVVPSARRTLAKEKRQGPLNEYLLDLQANPDKQLERWFYTDWLQKLQRRQQMASAAAAKRAAAAAAASGSAAVQQDQQQQQPATTTTEQPQRLEQQQQDQQQEGSPAAEVYEDKMPSFWSLDNPILATATLIAGAALVSTILHQ